MYVKIEFIVETPEYGKKEFKREIEKLIADIDSHTTLVSFEMNECNAPSRAMRNQGQLSRSKENRSF